MGDIYGAIIQVVFQTLNPIVSGELSLLSGLKDDVNAIKNELQTISVYLKYAEERAEGNEEAKDWVRRVRTLAYDIEDAIERYHMFLKESSYSKTKQFLSFEVRSMASGVRGLRETALDITRTRNSDRFNDRAKDKSVHEPLTTSYFICTVSTDVDAVGDDVAKGEIIELLKLGQVNTKSSTVAVVGMRGLGKTTVVHSIFQDKMVRSYCPLRAWVPVSHAKRRSDIVRSMIMQFKEPSKGPNIGELTNMDKKLLQRVLESFLKGKRYLIVFDDVQEGDIELITYIKQVLSSNNEGSRILMTTRYENVAHVWLDGSTNGMYKLKPLPSQRAWELFCKKTFKSSGGSCPPTLADLAQGIVRKCGGLPPAIISLSRLLSPKTDDMNEWKKVRQSLGYYLATNKQLSGINKTFTQNYFDLPFYLKPCFLYFGLFPKGQPIERMRLIRLWVAEGFIIVQETRGGLTPEDIAEDYMNELINTSMIEVKQSHPCGKVKSVGLVSEFLHEMIMSKLDELRFGKILSKKDSIGNEMSRRLFIHKNHEADATKFLDTIAHMKSSIRSLFMIEVALEIIPKVFCKEFIKSINLLKVLDLFNAPVDVVPKEVGMLLNLRYFSLRCTRVSALPRSIGKLEYLQTLDLKQTFISELPKEIKQLRRLRHLLGYSYEYDFGYSGHCLKINGVTMPEGSLKECVDLQNLGFLDLSNGHRTWAMELKNFTQLRKLGIIGIDQNQSTALCSVIDGMVCLRSLNILSKSKTESIDLASVTSPPTMLKRLCLSGSLRSIPSWINELHGLVKIRLRWSNLYDDPLETLQFLPNLVDLQLVEAYVGHDLRISRKGFQKLKILHLLDLHSLKSLSIPKGALPLLHEMSIGESKNLQVPADVKYLPTLKTLNFYNMPSHFTNRILPGEIYYSVVKHVPNVFFHNKHPKGYWQTYTLR
ncbi:hypothetical protein vseg_005438 [Gypsophila vaccaria]